MYRLITFLLILMLFVGNVSASNYDSTFNNTAPAKYLKLLFSPDLKMNSGMENILTLSNLSGQAVEKTIGSKWFAEDKTVGKVGGVVARFAKNILLDGPLDYYLVVVSHEYYGHGARYRELSVENIDYGFDAPPPYGNGGGHASTSITDPISLDEIIAIYIGGVESQVIINRKLNMRWMAQENIDYREAVLHNWSFRIMYDYFIDTKNSVADDRDGNDASEYLYLLNQKAGVTDFGNPQMDVDYLKDRLWIDFVNPLSWYAVYSIYKSYIYDGNHSTKVPMIKLGKVGYLPALRMSLTPFGPQYHFENYIQFDSKSVLVDLRKGDNTFYESWGGVELIIQNLFQRDNISVDLNAGYWKQPAISLLRNKVDEVGDGAGGMITMTSHFDLSRQTDHLAVVLELGYKTAGFAEGYDLDAAPIISFGFGYKY